MGRHPEITEVVEWGLELLAAATAKSLQSCPTLCDPIDGSPPGSPVPGILQARTLECTHLCMKCPLVSLILLKRDLVFPILLFSSISSHCSLKKAFLSLLAILWNSAFRCFYLSFSHLPFNYLFYLAISKASSDNILPFCIFFLHWGWFLITASCAMLWTCIHSSSGTLSIRSNLLNLFVTYTV